MTEETEDMTEAEAAYHVLESQQRPSGAWEHTCRRCGLWVVSPDKGWNGPCFPPEKKLPAKQPPFPGRWDCGHLGKVIEGQTVGCVGCNGNVRLKVYACAVHGECLPQARKEKIVQPDMHKCDGCRQFKQ